MRRTRTATPLFKTTVTIYSAFAPVTLEGLLNEALRGNPGAHARVGANALIASESTHVVDVASPTADSDLTPPVLAYFDLASAPLTEGTDPSEATHLSA